MKTKTPRRGGHSLIEVMIVLAISIIVLTAVYSVVTAVVKGDESIRVRVEMQLEAVKVMRAVTDVLKKSGRIDEGTVGLFEAGDFPYIYEDPTGPTGYGGYYGFAAANNKTITPKASPGDEDYGASHEVVFRLPADVDGNGGPTDANTGNVEWGTNYYAIVLVPALVGDANELQLREYDAGFNLVSTRTLGSHVERILFHTRATEPQPVVAPQIALGLNQIRVTAWFRRLDINGKTVTLRQVSTANLRSVGN